MKKQTLFIIILFVLFLGLITVGQYIIRQNEQTTNQAYKSNQEQVSTQEAFKELTPAAVKEQVAVTVDFGDGTVWKEDVRADTAYEALVRLSEDKKVKVEVAQYKYGVIVEKVATIANSAQKGWTFYVNGKLGRIASDKTVVRSKDVIEWKYKTL